MDSTVGLLFFFLLLLIGAVAGYVYYVNMKMAEAGYGQKKKNSGKKPRKKDKSTWSIGDM